MPSSPRPTLALLPALLATLAFGVSACATRTVTIPAALNCAELIPVRLRSPVEPAPLPADNSVGAWVAFGDAQTGKLEISEDRRATVLEIVDGCEAQERKVAKGLRPRSWWLLWR
jgi:hypothetical protein